MQPFLNAIELAALLIRIIEQAEQDVDAVEDDALRAHFLGLGLEAGEHAVRSKSPALHDGRRQSGVEEEKLVRARAPEGPSRTSPRCP